MLSLLLSLLISVPSPGQTDMAYDCSTSSHAKHKKDRSADIGLKYLDASFKTYDTIQKKVHSYAEPGYQEYRSSALLAAHLEENGFTIERGVADIPTAFVATFGKGRPVIGFLAEYDALPGLAQDTVGFRKPIEGNGYGHGCGHNMLGTGTVAAAVAISKWLAEGHEGTVKLFGCPAEEGGGGKNYMAADGVFSGLDAVFAWHPMAQNRVDLKPGLANLNVIFTFHGKSAHASGSPWDGRSALDGVEAFNYMMNMMREHVPLDSRIHYVITEGGEAPNVVPAIAKVNYYFRNPDVSVLMDIFERAKKAAKGAADGTGTTVEWEVINGNYPILANETLCKVVHRNLLKVGGVMLDEREKQLCTDILVSSGKKPDISNFEYVRHDIVPALPGGGSSDVGSVSLMAPLGKLYVASSLKGVSGHSWQQVAIGGSTIGTKVVINVGKVFYLTALDLYNDPSIVLSAKEEFEKARGKDFKYVPLTGDRKPPLDYR